MSKRKDRQTTVEEIKSFATEPVKDEVKEQENPSTVVSEAQREDSPFKPFKAGELHEAPGNSGEKWEGVEVPADGVERTFEFKGKEVADKDKIDTPEVDIEESDGKIVAVDRKLVGFTAKEPQTFEPSLGVEELAECEKEHLWISPKEGEGAEGKPTEDPEITRLEEEVARLKEEITAAKKETSEKQDEIARLNKEILESPAEELRAKLEVAKRENEILIGSVQKPPKQIFG